MWKNILYVRKSNVQICKYAWGWDHSQRINGLFSAGPAENYGVELIYERVYVINWSCKNAFNGEEVISSA